MDFTPPPFSNLRVDILNLDSQFSTILGRYKIIASPDLPSSSSSSPPSPSGSSAKEPITQSSLEVLLARTHKVSVCKTDRVSAQDVFTKLSNELREVLNAGDEVEINQATMFLLGALVHRYFRLIKEYDQSNKYTSYFWSPFDVRNCELFKAIRKALNLPDEMPKDYRMLDLVALDATTVVDALTVFLDNMMLDDRYMKYPHFAVDPNFKPYCEEIIKEHRVRGAAVSNQFKAISFIQSLVKQLDLEQCLFEKTLVEWCKQLTKDHADFGTLTIELIEEHLFKTVESVPMREKIADLLYTPFIVKNLAAMNHPTFLSEMKKCNIDTSSHIVIGGYTLLLKSKKLDERLTFCINQALGIEKKPDLLTDKDKLYGIQFLKKYITNNPAVALDYEFFVGKDKMDTNISRIELELTEKTKEHTAQSTTLSV